MAILKQKIGCLVGLMTLLLSLTTQVSAYLLVLNRIHNHLQEPITIHLIHDGEVRFIIKVGVLENITLPWGSVWLADTADNEPKGAWSFIALFNKNYERMIRTPYRWVLNGLGFSVKLGEQPTFFAGIYPMQGKAWTHLDIYKPGTPYLYPGG